MPMPFRHAVILALGIVTWTGCGKAEFQVARVSGTVTCGGRILTEGLVVFTPLGSTDKKTSQTGRSAAGMIEEDGSFVLTTYKKGDGAIIGTHTVQVFAPSPVDDDTPLTDANRFACGNAPLQQSVDPGDNVIELELSPPKSETARVR